MSSEESKNRYNSDHPDLEVPLHPPPTQIGNYKIESLLRKGGMSLLYIGIHQESQEAALIKVLLPKYARDPDCIALFLNEAKILSLTDHPNIVKLKETGQWEGGYFLVMEFIQGTSLREILINQPFSQKSHGAPMQSSSHRILRKRAIPLSFLGLKRSLHFTIRCSHMQMDREVIFTHQALHTCCMQ